ncbi:hypothetical protein DSECCO2_649600 [anaerobic digester metagenome]|nr:SRPBCC family protein [Lentimicrobiaceae bacterium]
MPVFEANQTINARAEIVWKFFSDPAILSVITPPDMGFYIKFPLKSIPAYAGMIIKYKVSPLFSIPLQWVTEITHVEENKFFVDIQLKGPFKIWHHQHIFKNVEEFTEMTDILYYELPFGHLGKWVAGRLVRKRINHIFKYREMMVNRIFNNPSEKRPD